MGLKGKLTAAMEAKCGGYSIHDIIHTNTHHVSTISPVVNQFEIHEGETIKIGSVVSWHYNDAGQKKFMKQIIEAIDPHKKSSCWKVIEGDVLEMYSSFTFLTAFESQWSIWTIEYEKKTEDTQHTSTILCPLSPPKLQILFKALNFQTMAGNLCITLTQSLPFSPKLYSSKPLLQKSHRISIAPLTPFLKFQDSAASQASTRGFTTICFSSPRNGPDYKGGGPDWPILRRWDVPWNWQTVSLSSLACGLSFVLTGLIETASIPYVGLDVEALSLDEKAEILFADQAITTAVVLIVLYTLTKSSQPLPDDIYRYDLKEPFNLQRGWLLWAGIGLAGAIGAIALTGVAMSAFNGEPPQRETDALARLLPLIGSSSISTASLLGITGVLAPILEETVFRGFFMVSLTKWVPTPLAVVISGAVFALAHLTPGQFPQLFVLGTALGFSYAQTRNLLTPITIHALWNSGVILLLTFLQLQGYDIREIIQGT